MTSTFSLNWEKFWTQDFSQNLEPSCLLFFCKLNLHQFLTSKMVKEKFVTVVDEPQDRGVSDDRGKRTNWHTREAMDFDPKSKPLHSPRDIFEYWRRTASRCRLRSRWSSIPSRQMSRWFLLTTACSFIPKSWRARDEASSDRLIHNAPSYFRAAPWQLTSLRLRGPLQLLPSGSVRA